VTPLVVVAWISTSPPFVIVPLRVNDPFPLVRSIPPDTIEMLGEIETVSPASSDMIDELPTDTTHPPLMPDITETTAPDIEMPAKHSTDDENHTSPSENAVDPDVENVPLRTLVPSPLFVNVPPDDTVIGGIIIVLPDGGESRSVVPLTTAISEHPPDTPDKTVT
jgi:hypothetical protein